MKKIYYWIIGVVLLLIITNPSEKAFKEYLGSTGYYGLKREYNFFVCSQYRAKGINYFAIAGNFFKSEPKRWTPPSDAIADSSKSDSAKADLNSLPDMPPKVDEYGVPIRKKDSIKDPLHILQKNN